MKANNYSETCIVFPRACCTHRCRNTKLWLSRFILAACACFFYWNVLGLISSDDWRTVLYRPALEAEVSWIVNDTAEEEAVSTCSLRHTIKKEDSLKRRFSFLVPILQWRDSFIDTHWEKLQNEPLPYGWKNQSFHDIGKTLSLLSHPANNRLFERKTPDTCVRCAVVGNGGILNGSRQGKTIDSHDFVFRVNGAIIKGFEDDVGTKTSFYGFTTNSLKNSLFGYYKDGFDKVPRDPVIDPLFHNSGVIPSFQLSICCHLLDYRCITVNPLTSQAIGYIFIPAETRDYVMLAAAIQGVSVPSGPDKGDSPSELFGHNVKTHQFKMIHPSFIQYVTQRFLKSPQLEQFRDLYMPTTGALMLFVALHTCDQVSAYGFITENYKKFSDHYYDKLNKPLVLYANHDMEMEGRLWKQLHFQKVLWLYQRQKSK